VSAAGASLVNALLRAARYYAANGRPVFLQRQEHTPGRTHAHADLVGGVDGRAVALEAKMTRGDYFPLEPKRAAQRAALSELRSRGAGVALVVEFTDHGEIYVASWWRVEQFLVAAWRRSLSLTWFRAWGHLIPQLHAGDESRRCALWLDFETYPTWRQALELLDAERAGQPVFAIDGDLERDAARDRRRSSRQSQLDECLAARPAPGTEEYRAYVRQLAQEGVGRVLKGAGRGKGGTRPIWRGGQG
jgi:hypothetical protein